MKKIDHTLGKFVLRYLLDESTGHICMVLLPGGMQDHYEERRKMMYAGKNSCNAWDIGSLCHLSLRHHPQGNGAGNTLKYGKSTEKLHYVKQDVVKTETGVRIVTLMEADEGYQIEHAVDYAHGGSGVEIETTFINHTGRSVELDMLTSFSLDNLSPFQKDSAPYKLKLHRFRGGWSMEGKHTEDTIEDLNLEETWVRAFPESERYGVLGSHPVKRWFPFGCVEDTEYHVYWAAQLGSNSSWQMELSKDGDCYSLSGGIADCEFGNWWKQIKDGESFTAPKAYVSVSKEGFWDVCQNITDMFQKYVDEQPVCERELPIIFNEWCYTWGEPTHDKMVDLTYKLKDMPVRYLVIDAGWSKKEVEDHDPQGSNGDWEYDPQKFPHGLLALSRQVREAGFHLGIWMEFEVTTEGAKVHSGIYDAKHLYRNGEIIQTGKNRRFWDFRKSEVITYLKEKVIDFLRKNELFYLKVDYNGSIGCGCDGAESPGEGLRAQMEGVYQFFELMRKELPELVIENCASGGHRLEPRMMGITAMSSFSDAHECREIPYIAVDLHQLILPRQSQIWAVISPELSVQEVQYRLASAMLGRFCLSGEIGKLNEEQWLEVRKAAVFYESVKNIIKCGRSRLFRESTNNHHYLKGCQVLVRYGSNGEVLIVYHSFENPKGPLIGELPEGNWKMAGRIGADVKISADNRKIEIIPEKSWEAAAVHLVEHSSGGEEE